MIKKKILPLSTLIKTLKKNKKNKVVFTNGCFDILHSGHVTYLEKAKRLGDILVVALNSDASTRRLKGPSRPVNTLSDRAQVIAALESVNYVVSFSEDTPLRLIKAIKPNLLVKGGDYRPETIVGYHEVKSHGGKVLSLPFVKGKSTTQTIKKLQNK